MTVYVDYARLPYGRMFMSHMVADTEKELHEMAAKIGVSRRWYQGDHYDVCLSKRSLAIQLGAVTTTSREVVKIRRKMT